MKQHPALRDRFRRMSPPARNSTPLTAMYLNKDGTIYALDTDARSPVPGAIGRWKTSETPDGHRVEASVEKTKYVGLFAWKPQGPTLLTAL
jgi:hypothetical protein